MESRLHKAVKVAVLVFALCEIATTKSANKLDMSHPFNSDTLFWPRGQWNFSHETFNAGNGDPYYQGGQYSAGEHGGTHIDSPIHFAENTWALDEIPLDKLEGPAVVVDISDKASNSRDYAVQVTDLTDWEESHGAIPDGAILLMCSGWDRKWPNRAEVFGNDRDDVSDFHFPGFHGDAASWLVANRNIAGIGVDTPSIDAGNVMTSVVHRTVMAVNIYGLENVKGICEIPPSGATIAVSPMKIEGGSGGPARIIARWGDSEGCSSRSSFIQYSLTMMMLLAGILYHLSC